MLAVNYDNNFMDLGADGDPVPTPPAPLPNEPPIPSVPVPASASEPTIEQQIRTRAARIRDRLKLYGLPVVLGTAVATTFTFAGAFSLARTERVWSPALMLGFATLLGGLGRYYQLYRVASQAAAAPTAPSVPTVIATGPSPAASPNALGFYY